ncbi:MAG: uroporphyrinogen-III C-methyltransferase [Burkholderiaceae bacterium]|nr:uroporphyrinogen-III C-methyltransferase [Burkholderiaceae bacterium]
MAHESLQSLPASAESAAASVPPFEINRRALLWIAVTALIVAIFAAGYSYRQLGNVKRESARRLSELQQSVSAANETANRADAEARAARQQAAAVEARLAEEQGQREALEQLYSDLSRGRDEAVLVEVERLITVAAQELQLSGNVASALAALQTADARLSRSENARFVPLRRGLARDIDRLKAAPAVDFTGIALKLDQLVAAVDSWPLLAGATSTPAPLPARAQDSTAPSSATWWQRHWHALQGELGEYRDLIRIRHVDSPESVLLDGQQQTLVRQQLRLRLLNARQALLARNDRLYRADLTEAQALITRYVDTRAPQLGGAPALLQQLASTALSVEVPTIGDSMAAVRAIRTARAR